MVWPGKLHPTQSSVLNAVLEKLENNAIFALLIDGDVDTAKSLESLKRTSTGFVFAAVGHIAYLPVSRVILSLTSNLLGSRNRDNSTMT